MEPYQDPLARRKQGAGDLIFAEPLEAGAPDRHNVPTSPKQASEVEPCRGLSPARDEFEVTHGDDAETKATTWAQAKHARIILARLRQTRAAARPEQGAGSSEFSVKAAYQDQARTGPGANLLAITAIGRCTSVENSKSSCARSRRPTRRTLSLSLWSSRTVTSEGT